ncbi:biliverdin-producing heme oxygenase [Chitinimonas taiwanensis]|jgi:heme oxygenase (biliverdin-IX-beta and delta-forming)|uniref:Heme oxygenase n=1 Tax=Chitinimonas taiwanensis DSM 18899 TaxID=1121279 RepID=A0A1K2HD68_9NEIS|nr:biliverdin-producing heme oxygenase [Chitinimonas taiwanensis]SFZ74489.1 heme oxygenase [Chitinimonas taiwanensis DSM 18899]
MTTDISASLAQRLKTETHAQHERMHGLMEQGQPFADRTRYARFVAAQYLFQRDVEQLFADPAVRTAVPDLDSRGRSAVSLLDLHDLGATQPDDAIASQGVQMPAALGWLYVSEGSTLGAAFLFKEARAKLGLDETFGARNLAAYPEGRAQAWRRFLAALQESGLNEAEQAEVVQGAHAAYDRFGALLETHLLATQP